MKFTILTLILLAVVNMGHAQRYTLHSATKGVSVLSGGKSVNATVGMELSATDQLVIPDGGTAEVLNAVDKRIYKSVRPGKVTVTRLMIEARQSATDKLAAIGDKIDVGRKGGDKRKRVYGEKGMVNRSILVAGEGIEETPQEETDSVCAVKPISSLTENTGGCCCIADTCGVSCAQPEKTIEK